MNTPNIPAFGLSCYFLEKSLFLKEVQLSPRNRGVPREGHSVAIHRRSRGTSRLAVVGPGSQKPILQFLRGPPPSDGEPVGLGGDVGNLTHAADFQRLPGAGLGFGLQDTVWGGSGPLASGVILGRVGCLCRAVSSPVACAPNPCPLTLFSWLQAKIKGLKAGHV